MKVNKKSCLSNAVAAFYRFAILRKLFAGDDSFAGAYRSASTAVDAGVGIDVVDFAFRDGANGAFGQTSAASHTRVGDYVSHDC